jgi:hypothetical protein
VSLNNVGEYVVFPAETFHQGFFSAVNKIVVIMQLFCGYSNSAKLPRVNHSETLTIGIQTGFRSRISLFVVRMDTSGNLEVSPSQYMCDTSVVVSQ